MNIKRILGFTLTGAMIVSNVAFVAFAAEEIDKAEIVSVSSKIPLQEKAQRLGIRYSRVNPKNTSALAFDGSGFVSRNNKKDLYTFNTGKVYHSDLNASYNIGARYFIREILKTFSEKRRSEVLAKVPELQTRTKCTLSSLISLTKAI